MFKVVNPQKYEGLDNMSLYKALMFAIAFETLV